MKRIGEINKLYLTGGVLGTAIIYTVMKGISELGPTYSIGTILIAQLSSAAIIDALGAFGTKQISFHYTKIIGIALMIIGIIVFKLKA